MTNDVETTSLELNRPVDFMAEKVKNIGLPRLIDLYSKYDIEGTFFFSYHIFKLMPDISDIVKENGHEIGCHGYIHKPKYFFDNLSLKDQIYYLKKAKNTIEKNSNSKVVSFRAPELLLNEDTLRALEKTGFKYDSSIAPQRFDGPLSRGFSRKIKWMTAPRGPYNMSYENIVKAGESKILEIPISSFIFSYMGTTMRVSPSINKFVQKIVFSEARKKNIPVVFLIHPTEAIELNRELLKKSVKREGPFFSGFIRKKMKYKNLGKKALNLTENILKDAKKEGAQFISISRFGKKFKRRSGNENIHMHFGRPHGHQ